MALRIRLSVCVLATGLAFGTVAGEAAASSRLSITRARRPHTRSRARSEGASYALTGYCVRKSARRVPCWGAIIWSDGSAAAQKILVTKKAGKVQARRY